MTTLPSTNLTMLTLLKPEGQLELSLARRPIEPPKEKECPTSSPVRQN